MTVHVLHPLHDAFLEFIEMPEGCRPCWINRLPGGVLLAVDPRSSRLEVIAWAIDNLTREEQNAYRAGFGFGPVGTPLSDRACSDGPVFGVVPEALRLPTPQRRPTDVTCARSRELREQAAGLREQSRALRERRGA